jgi:hypothetical protein
VAKVRVGTKCKELALSILSALPPLATEERTFGIGRSVPVPDSCIAAKSVLVDHLIGCHKHRLWDREAECLRNLQIDDNLVLCRRLHRQVGWLLALENAIDVARRAAILINRMHPIGSQTAANDEETFPVDSLRWAANVTIRSR